MQVLQQSRESEKLASTAFWEAVLLLAFLMREICWKNIEQSQVNVATAHSFMVLVVLGSSPLQSALKKDMATARMDRHCSPRTMLRGQMIMMMMMILWSENNVQLFEIDSYIYRICMWISIRQIMNLLPRKFVKHPFHAFIHVYHLRWPESV